MSKTGFVYIWYDRKHKRYYIGCHWGSEDDGYICSSSNMKAAWNRRKSSDHYVPPRLNKPAPIRSESKSKLRGGERTEKQIAASLAHSQRMKGVKRGNYNAEHGKKISESRKGKSTGFIPKSAFKHGSIPWNKGKRKGEDYGATKGK